MRELDETDLEILRLLVSDGRRPYNEIADAVNLSPPTVSDRIDRLADLGVIRRFTVDLDRSLLADGVSVLVDLRAEPGRVGDVRAAIEEIEGVEHVFVTAEGRIVFQARLQENAIEPLLDETIDTTAVREYDVSLLVDSTWYPQPRGVEFALECDECGNSVTSEGESARLGGEIYHFCCSSCKSQFEEQYEELQEAV
ncbi:AsnC family transcriptional regulator [Halorussus halophilus]|uniref:AsnC family transcriptional regulator n=1 Tax=Halorussus halophilus TaxID=2650975 RepID=UPI001300D589|nr:AsnC family transcriptional regulator [Halorussus halophilus]